MAVATREEPASGGKHEAARIAGSWHVVVLPVVVIATIALQATTLSYYFYFDDYVPFAEIVRHGGGEYTWQLLNATDVTPNWRPLPGLLYLASYEIAGMNPLPVRLVVVAMHAGTAGLLYVVLWRTTERAWAAAAGALVFGLNPAYVGALSQVTTATQVMTGFFLVATLAAVIECARSERVRNANAWLGAAVVAYLLTIGSHEGMAIMFPAFGVALLLFDDGGGDRGREGWLIRVAARAAPFAVIGIATAAAFTACDCTESDVWGTSYAWNQTQIYLGRLLYPVGLELPTEVNGSHVVAAAVLAIMMGAVLAIGPKIGRVGVVWIVLALAPHVFIEYFTASRYLYVPSIGFALVVASLVVMIGERVPPKRAAVTLGVGAVLFAALCGWYAYQTVEQNEHFANATGDWERFERDVTRVFPEVPEGARVEIIGGPFQRYEYQLFILPAFAETTWGAGVTAQDYEPGSLPAEIALASDNPYVAEYRDGELVRVHDDDRSR